MHQVVLLFVLEHARLQREIARFDQHFDNTLVFDVLIVVKSIANGLLALVQGHVNVVDHQDAGKFPVDNRSYETNKQRNKVVFREKSEAIRKKETTSSP